MRARGISGFLTGVPAYRALRRVFPSHELVLAAPPGLAPLARLTGAIDRLIPSHAREPVPWVETKPPDLAVNLHGRGPASHHLLHALDPGTTMAFECPYSLDDSNTPGSLAVARSTRSADAPAWQEEEHEVARWCRLMRHYGIGANEEDLDLLPPLADSPAPGVVVVHPGAAVAGRRWPPERFGTVARTLRADGHSVVVTGSASETGLARAVASAAGLSDADVLAGRLQLVDMAALVASAALVVSNDTGIAHLATAYRIPSVTLFGPVSPRLSGPPPRPYHEVLWRGDGGGDPHDSTVHPALLRIQAGDVVHAARRARDAGAGYAPAGFCLPPATGRSTATTGAGVRP